MKAPASVLILFAHPALQKSRVNKHLIRAVQDLEHVTFHDLYEIYPQLLMDVAREQQLLVDHQIIVFHHPFYWYSSPAIIKEWQDLVLEYGFAYGEGGTALQGKKLFNVITTGGSEEAYQPSGYNRFRIREFLTPFEQTAHLCGMEYLPPFIVHGTHQLATEEDVMFHAQIYRQLVQAMIHHHIDYPNVKQLTKLNDHFGQFVTHAP